MAHPEAASRQALALDGYSFLWRPFRETGYPGFEEASFGLPQPAAGRASGTSRDAAQPNPSSLSLSSSSSSQSTPRHTLPAQDIRQWYPNVYVEPQHYYDTTWHRQSPSHPHPIPLSSFRYGPYLPSVSPPGTAFATDCMSESILVSLRALQSQFTAFQESLGGVKSDVQDALSQLHTLRTAQNKTDNCIAELEGVIGVNSTGTASRGRGRRGGGRGRGERAGTHTELTLEGADTIVPEKTLVQSLASIQSGVEELLARESRASQLHPSLISQGTTSSVNPTEQASFRTSSPPRSFVDPSQQYSTLHLTQSAFAISSTSQSEQSSPHSSIVILTPEFGTSPPPAAPEKEYADVSIQACLPSPALEPSCSLSHSQKHALGFTLVNWNVNPATPGQSAGSSARPTAYTTEYFAQFLHDIQLASATDTEADPEDAQMTPSTDGDGTSLASEVKTGLELIPAAPAHRPHSSPIEADDGGLTSSLPTPPSETFDDDLGHRVISCSTREHGTSIDPTLISCTSLRRNFPVIPTPPSLTPEPSGGEDRRTLGGRGRGSARQGLFGTLSESLSPLTPPLPSPSPAVGGLLSEEGGSDLSGQAVVQKVTEELTDPSDDARGMAVRGGDNTEGVSADVSMRNGERPSTGPQMDRVGVNKSIPATSSAVCNKDLSRAPQGSSVGQPLPEHRSDASDIAPACLPMNGNDFGFSSLWRNSLPPSQYATLSDSPGSGLTQEENEMFPSHQPSPASSLHSHSLHQLSTSASSYANDSGVARASSTLPLELSAVDPSALHAPTPIVLTHGPKSASLPPISDRPQSPLASLDDAAIDSSQRALHGRDGDNDNPRWHKKPRATTSPAPADRPRGTGSKGRQSTPYHVPSSSCAVAVAASVVRAASESTAAGNLNGRGVGGPSASLNELVLLARRGSSKIHLRHPESVRGVKRKRDIVDSKREGEARRESSDEPVRPGASIPVDHDTSREGQAEMISTEGSQVSANVPVASHIEVVGSAPGTLMPAASRLAPESFTSSGFVDNAGEHPDVTSHLPVTGKRLKKQSERGREAHAARMASEQARLRQKKRRQASKPKQSLVKYHVRNGQIVALEPEPTPEPRSLVRGPATPSVSEPSGHSERAARKSRTATEIRHRKGREDKAMKAPLSSPAVPSPHSTRCVKSSSTKEEASKIISQGGGTWPELPSMFSHWDAQFIQCDNCDMWFHYGCVAITPGDPRLEPETLFICPTCHIQSARRQTLRNHDDTCARPDCPEPHVTGETELYFVEKLVGRKKTEDHEYVWLAKWEGFPMTQATWIPKENVVGDGTKMFAAFFGDATEEGADLSQDVVLLQEALEAGWKG